MILGVWLGLFAADLCDQLGLLGGNDSVEDALDVALAELGQAVDGSAHHAQAILLHASKLPPRTAHPGLPTRLAALPTPGVALPRAEWESRRGKRPAKIHLRQRVFLI